MRQSKGRRLLLFTSAFLLLWFSTIEALSSVCPSNIKKDQQRQRQQQSLLQSQDHQPEDQQKTYIEKKYTINYKSHLRAKIAHSIAKGERRAKEREATLRTVCQHCSRPPTLCVCNVLPSSPAAASSSPIKISTKYTNILILQHPNERRKKNLSTVPLLRLVLEHVKVIVGYTFVAHEIPDVKDVIESGSKPLLLYPCSNAIPIDDDSGENNDSEFVQALLSTSTNNDDGNKDNNNKLLLIIIDGTWTEAKRMVRDSPSLLDCCQAIQFTSDSSSIYNELRREPHEHCISTLEACARALTLLEPNTMLSSSTTTKGASAVDYLYSVLQAHVHAHLVNARIMEPRSVGAAKSRLYAKNRRRREIELSLFSEESNKHFKINDDDVDTRGNTNIVNHAQHCMKLSDGAILRSLQSSDASLVDSWWKYHNTNSLPLVMRRIELDGGTFGGCLGIEVDGKLIASIMRYEGGALGMLFVKEDFRRRGYGRALLRQATHNLVERGEERVAFIIDGNSASETLFRRAGWERDAPNTKGKTGKRKAKRKWIHRRKTCHL